MKILMVAIRLDTIRQAVVAFNYGLNSEDKLERTLSSPPLQKPLCLSILSVGAPLPLQVVHASTCTLARTRNGKL